MSAKTYHEDEFLQISGIQHFKFCKRQWALIHIEKQWSENWRTVEGHLIHENAHNKFFTQSRNNIIISRGMPVYSEKLGISGECDIVEFRKDNCGISIVGLGGTYMVCPVEYKRGKPMENQCNDLQLCAQAMCLEEMLCCRIDAGYLYYNEIKRRCKVELNQTLRDELSDTVDEMHEMYTRKYTPKVKPGKACNACSLKDICLPVLCKNKSAKVYIDKLVRCETYEETS